MKEWLIIGAKVVGVIVGIFVLMNVAFFLLLLTAKIWGM